MQETWHMRKLTLALVTIGLIIYTGVLAQNISWTDVTDSHNLIDGVKLFAGQSGSPKLKAWYLDIDMNDPDIGIEWPFQDKPFLTQRMTQPHISKMLNCLNNISKSENMFSSLQQRN